MRREPLCARCLDIGRVTLATVADHIVAHGGDWKRFLLGELQSLCASCIPAASNLKKYTIIIPTSGWTAFHSSASRFSGGDRPDAADRGKNGSAWRVRELEGITIAHSHFLGRDGAGCLRLSH